MNRTKEERRRQIYLDYSTFRRIDRTRRDKKKTRGHGVIVLRANEKRHERQRARVVIVATNVMTNDTGRGSRVTAVVAVGS